MTNPIDTVGGINDIDLKDYAFLPIIEIHNYAPLDNYKHLDIFIGNPNDEVYDLEKFYDYLTWLGIQRYRDGKAPKFDYLQNMRACTQKDFNSRNYTLDDTLKKWVS